MVSGLGGVEQFLQPMKPGHWISQKNNMIGTAWENVYAGIQTIAMHQCRTKEGAETLLKNLKDMNVETARIIDATELLRQVIDNEEGLKSMLRRGLEQKLSQIPTDKRPTSEAIETFLDNKLPELHQYFEEIIQFVNESEIGKKWRYSVIADRQEILNKTDIDVPNPEISKILVKEYAQHLAQQMHGHSGSAASPGGSFSRS